jgi:hypothetical protein
MDPRPTDPPDEVPAEVLDHAIHRLNDGATRQEVIAELVEMGVTESAAATWSASSRRFRWPASSPLPSGSRS